MSKPVAPPVDPRPTDPSDRLTGWKDIAAFLGKGVRTAQRWEDELGLPIHRLGKEGGGEIVFAYKTEIARWLAATELARSATQGPDGRNGLAGARPEPRDEPPTAGDASEPMRRPAGTRRPWSFRPMTATAALAVAAALLAWLALSGWRPNHVDGGVQALASQPAHWQVEDDHLKVFDSGRNLLWTRHFPSGLVATNYSTTRPVNRSVIVDDLDADGTRDVVFVPRTGPRSERRLYVFNNDGSTRFVQQPVASVRFGDTSYGPPWLAEFLSATKTEAGTRLWAGFIHGMWFPTVLQQLDPQGRVLSEYWSNGYVTFVGTDTWQGRPVVLVGATNNEHRGASLAIFEAGQVTGAAPAANARYRCEDGCPPGRPLAFVVFPRGCIPRADDTQPFVEEAWVDGRDQVVVLVENGRAKGPGDLLLPASVYYTLGSDLTPVRVELTRQFHMAHSRLERAGLLDHAFDDDDLEALFPLLRWQDSRFVSLPPAPVTR